MLLVQCCFAKDYAKCMLINLSASQDRIRRRKYLKHTHSLSAAVLHQGNMSRWFPRHEAIGVRNISVVKRGLIYSFDDYL